MIDIKETPLSTEQRNSLDDKEFGIPELRAYPLNDKSHVEQAVRMFNHVDPEYEKELADNLNKAIKKFGLSIEVGDTNRFKKYVKEGRVMSRVDNVGAILEGLSDMHEGIQKFKWVQNPKETYRIEGQKPGPETYSISKTSSGRITKRFGYDVRLGIQKLEHFGKLEDAKRYVEELVSGDINEASKRDIVPGAKFVLNSNITIQYVRDKNGKDLKDTKSDGKWEDDFLKGLEKATNNKMTISKSKTELKLTPGCEIEIVSVSGKSYLAKVSNGICFYLDPWNDLKKLDVVGSTPKAKEDKGPILYAIYGTPDIYGRADTQWHWARNDEEESDKEFQSSIKYTAKRMAEKEYREYDPRSIKTMYFRSEDAFLKQCKKLGINPKL